MSGYVYVCMLVVDQHIGQYLVFLIIDREVFLFGRCVVNWTFILTAHTTLPFSVFISLQSLFNSSVYILIFNIRKF